MIDLSEVVGSGDGGRITSGDILTAARLLEMEKSVPRIEMAVTDGESEPVSEPAPAETLPASLPESEAPAQVPTEIDAADVPEDMDPGPEPGADDPVTMTSASDVGGEPIEVPASPWDAYNGSTDGLSEIALPGAEQSWGEAEANIAAIAEEAAAQIYGRQEEEHELVELVAAAPAEPSPVGKVETTPTEPPLQPESIQEPEDEPAAPYPVAEPTAVVDTLDEIQAAVDEEMAQPERDQYHAEVMMDFGTLELVDPESVWAEGAEDFAPWFLANSKQLGDVLGLRAGLNDPRQYTTKSTTGVIGHDDNGEAVVVVSSQQAAADDPDLGRALGMAASSGAGTVALVSAKFGEEQLQALAWLNSQTKSGVKWFGIEMKVVRIADSPPAMMFDLVASPPAS